MSRTQEYVWYECVMSHMPEAQASHLSVSDTVSVHVSCMTLMNDSISGFLRHE